MSIDQLFVDLFEPELHSGATRQNTDFGHQIGKGIEIKWVRPYLAPKNFFDQFDDSASLAAFNLKNPTEDGRISLRIMPHDTCMQANATFLCVSRSTWDKIKKIHHIMKEYVLKLGTVEFVKPHGEEGFYRMELTGGDGIHSVGVITADTIPKLLETAAKEYRKQHYILK